MLMLSKTGCGRKENVEVQQCRWVIPDEGIKKKSEGTGERGAAGPRSGLLEPQWITSALELSRGGGTKRKFNAEPKKIGPMRVTPILYREEHRKREKEEREGAKKRRDHCD